MSGSSKSGAIDRSFEHGGSQQTQSSSSNTQLLWVIAGSAITAILGYGIYVKYIQGKSQSGTPQTANGAAQLTATDRAKLHIKKELIRLKDPQLIEHQDFDDGQILQKKDFYDLLFLIQLKSKLKLQKDVSRNQRERTKLLERALASSQPSNPQSSQQHQKAYMFQQYEAYISLAMEIMQREFDQYEDEFSKILDQVGITNDTWEASREVYIQGNLDETAGGNNANSIENIDKRIYEYLPSPNLPKSLTREKAKEMMIDVNHRSAQIFKNLRHTLSEQLCPMEFEPFLMETLGFDLAFFEYGINENVFRFAIYKYELQKDKDVKEQLEEYLSS